VWEVKNACGVGVVISLSHAIGFISVAEVGVEGVLRANLC
jgi:hypothetical protein